jgi:acetyl-CoA carboxylase carboxyl transferase subunit beta
MTDPDPWWLCGRCRKISFGPRMARAAYVCPGCGRHERLAATDRVQQLFDEDSVTALDFVASATDPLGWVDSKPYPVRLAEARDRTGLAEAVLCVRAAIDGHPIVAAVMDFAFMGGSLGSAVGELVTLTAETALAERTPLLLVTASGGARMQEGALSLMQMAKTSQALAALDEAGILTISLITDPTFGGVAASFATLSDVLVAEPGARLGFAGPRIIEQVIRQTLPTGFQTAEFLYERGFVDVIRSRAELRPTLARLLAAGGASPVGRGAAAAVAEVNGDAPIITDPAVLPTRAPWEAVRGARALERPTALEYIGMFVDGFEELHGDRLSGDCRAIVAGLGRFEGRPVAVIGHQKAHTPADLMARNYGMATPSGYRKSARVLRLAAKLGIPVLTLIDTPGAYPGLEAEEEGQAIAIAENLRLLAGLPVPVLSVIIGEGGSGGALALAFADEVLISASGVYSVISPEGCASILWKDPSQAPRAAAALRMDARSLLELGIVDGVVPEPAGGAGADPAAAAELLRRALAARLPRLAGRDPRALVRERRARFRAFGAGDQLPIEFATMAAAEVAVSVGEAL